MKQKHWILLKYLPACVGVTLNVAVPVTGPARLVARVEGRHVARADRDRVGHDVGAEIPRQAGGDVAVEADRDRLARDGLDRRGLSLVDPLGGAAEAGDLAEHAVERHGGIAHAEHGNRERARRSNRRACSFILHPASASPIFTMVIAKNRIARLPSTSPITQVARFLARAECFHFGIGHLRNRIGHHCHPCTVASRSTTSTPNSANR